MKPKHDNSSPDLAARVLGFRTWQLGWELDPDQPFGPTPPAFPSQGYQAPPSVYPSAGGQQYYQTPPQQDPRVQVNVGTWAPPRPEPRYHLVNGERVPTLLPESYSARGQWHPGVNRARCSLSANRYSKKEKHTAPGHECACGLYALHGGDMLVAAGTQGVRVIGAISAWGRLEVHGDGFRAEFAQVVALAYDPAQGVALEHRIRLTAEAFDVPCVPIDDLVETAGAFGQPVPESTRPNDSVYQASGGKSISLATEAHTGWTI